MYTYIFFDDDRLNRRLHTRREYGVPQLQAVYTDGNVTTPWPGPWVMKLDDGSYRMLYQGLSADQKEKCLYCARSTDGIHFEPEDVSALVKEKQSAPHAIMPLPGYDEVGRIVEDKINDPSERYKLLYASVDWDKSVIENRLFVSPDLLNWTEVPGVSWGIGGEPLVGVFFNEKKQCFTLLIRPLWMKRMVGIVETKDWRTYTPYELCMRADSMDDPLDEIYGMPAYAYEGRYIGLTHIYNGFQHELRGKCDGGPVKVQLAYSWDGSHWQRSLREPFISGLLPDRTAKEGLEAQVIYACEMVQAKDGSHLIYAEASSLEHGPCFRADPKELVGKTYIYQLRQNGFIRLVSDSETEDSVIATRENLWNGGDLHINLKAKKATVAVYQPNEACSPTNTAGICRLADGMDHSDCVPFTGDSTDWVPQFRSGKTLEDLKGKTLTFEIKFTDGELYAVSGDMVPLFSTEGDRYRRLGILPDVIF